jgi:pterin-4a-carbinolamine dehydratase
VTAKRAPYLFISYRRDDTQWIARALYRHLSERFGSQRVFMDRIEIRGGDNFHGKIDAALRDATCVLAIIGQEWLTLKDKPSRRPRIEKRNDWVRHEIRTAIREDKQLIPLYVDGAQIIQDARRLPADVRLLTDTQGIQLSDNYWEAGLREVVRRLDARGFKSWNAAIPMPEKRKKVTPFSPKQLVRVVATLPGWDPSTTDFPTADDESIFTRNELYKEYAFDTFRQATRFMAETSAAIDRGEHHPRWENIWTTVRVWLCTWDVEFKPSIYDVKLARLLDKAYRQFRGKQPRGRSKRK